MKASFSKVIDFGADFMGFIKKSVADVVAQNEGDGFGDDVIAPEYPPEWLKTQAIESSVLSPSIRAMVSGTIGQGHSIRPILDLDESDIDEKIKVLIFQSFIYFDDKPGDPDSIFQKAGLSVLKNVERMDDISDDLVEQVKDYIKMMAYADQVKAEAFFSQCCKKYSYFDFLEFLHYDFYRCGYCAFEVERNIIGDPGDIRYLRYLPSEDVRVTPVSNEKVEVKITRRINPLVIDTEVEDRFFSKIVVKIEGNDYYCKEFGDPRTISQKTGKYYQNDQDLATKEGADIESGNEVVLIRDGYGPYGQVSWGSAMPEVLGSREASEYNWNNFKDGFMTRLAIVVKNAVLGADTRKAITEYAQRGKGKPGQHKVLILEAHADDDNRQEDIKFEDISKTFQNDAFFLEYSKYNEETVAAQYGLSKIARGKSQDYNRATAYASREHDETMVYSTRRAKWDRWITETLLLAIGLQHIRYESNSVPTSDYQEMSKNLTEDVKTGIITPNEARGTKEKYYRTTLDTVEGFWGDQPMPMTLQGYKPDADGVLEIEDEVDERTDEQLAAEASKQMAEDAKKLSTEE